MTRVLPSFLKQKALSSSETHFSSSCFLLSRVRSLTYPSIVFIHGFTGDPRGTWTCAKSQKKRDLDGAEIDQHCEAIGSSPPKLLKLLSSPTKQPHHAKVSTAQPRIASGQRSSANKSGRAEVYWPRDLLPRTVPGARVLTYGYDTKVRHSSIGVVSDNSVHDHSWNFLCAVEESRRKEPLRPLLLVAHSLGGLVVQEALRKSCNCEREPATLHLYNVVRSIVGVLFFGTPHRGADPRGLIHHALTRLAKGVGFRYNDKVVDTLMPGGEHLREMRDEFTKLARQGQWIIYCFQEEYGLRGLLHKKVSTS
jgi:pimeloyl-ACP methyl ester carboxylesterase